jgi:pimeloyl-ACP methyl ester carboxylesterase
MARRVCVAQLADSGSTGLRTGCACRAGLQRRRAAAYCTGGFEIGEAQHGAGFCQIDGTMRTPGSVLRVRVGMPEQWNGKFLFEAVGGGVGVVVDLQQAMQRGYAAATTDTGHISTPEDFQFWLDPKLRADWIHRGVHTATVGSKALVQAYYARTPERSYLRGCSNGGRAAVMEAQRYPEDYDGIIAGAPAADPGLITLNWIWDTQVLAATPLSPDDWKLIGRTVRDRCDARDGVTDGIIQDDRRCELPRAQLACSSDGQKNCLSPAKLQALDKLWNKPVLSDGRRLPPEGHGYEDQLSTQIFYAGASQLTLLRAMASPEPAAGNEFELRTPEPPLPLSKTLPYLLFGIPPVLEIMGEAYARGLLLPDRNIDVHSFDVVKDLMKSTNARSGAGI